MDHHHDHHSHEPTSFNASFAIAIFLMLSYTLIEIYFGFSAHSVSLLADAVHNFGDGLGLILAWFANWLLSLSPRKRYSYGFKRMSIISALINAFILVITSTVIAFEAILRLFHLTPINETTVISIAILGILVNGGSSLLFKKGAESDLNIQSAFLHLLADACILLGVVISAIIIHYTTWLWLDPIVGLIIVGIILWGTWGLLQNSLRLIMDAVPHYIDYADVKTYLSQLSGVTTVHDLHIWGLSTREVALTAHLVMPKHPLTDDDHQMINKTLKDKFKIQHATIQVETGNTNDPCVRKEICTTFWKH
ncbi:MAG: cobalt transporter [Gammaproteobacteria bacterium RIFCSPHIGHO2_12_FULL_42_10]|nr:MAG: cobalt transporter [Gammaproteobacteria bacterium RIFCSPHIGHO2_12_FULL_42_10]